MAKLRLQYVMQKIATDSCIKDCWGELIMYKVKIKRHLNQDSERTYSAVAEAALFITNCLWTEPSLNIWDISVTRDNCKVSIADVLSTQTNNYILGGAYAC